MDNYWLETAKRLQAIAETGLFFNENKYDLERYEELKQISFEMIGRCSGTDPSIIANLFANEKGYQTPKVDIRAVIFKEDKILMVRERIDDKWSIPGGWADVGYTPFEIAVKESWEETGLKVEPIRVLAVFDKRCHPHPDSPFYSYKIFILCRKIGGELTPGVETSDVAYFGLNELPELSIERITAGQIKIMFEYLSNPNKGTLCD
jgi:ADP-ribose pyrophosphatase YjhB (NUDIX family)